MRTQLHNWRLLVDHIIDKVWEYIDELEYWDAEPKLWVDAESDSVILGDGDKVYPGKGDQSASSSLRMRLGRWSPTSTKSRTLPPAGLTSARRRLHFP